MSRILKHKGLVRRDRLIAAGSAREIMEAADRSARLAEEASAARAAEIEREADRRGFEAGMARAAAACVEAEARRLRWLRGAREDLVEVALAAAARLNERARDLDPAVVARICEEAVLRIRGARRVEVRVAPADAAALDGLAAGGLPVAVVPDPAVTPGGCLVETDLGTVDARIETRLDALRSALEAAIDRLGDEGGEGA